MKADLAIHASNRGVTGGTDTLVPRPAGGGDLRVGDPCHDRRLLHPQRRWIGGVGRRVERARRKSSKVAVATARRIP